MAALLEHTVMASGGDFTSLSAAVNHLEASHPNLVTADVYAHIKIDGAWAASDTAYVQIHNITTDATRYLYIYTTVAARHLGIPSTSYYNIKGQGYGLAMVDISVNYVEIEGLQAWNQTTWGDSHGYRTRNTGCKIHKCIGRTDGAAQHGFMDDDVSASSYFENCLAYSCGGYGFMVHKTVYNCTACHCGLGGFCAPYWAATYENCLAHGNTTADFSRAGSDPLTLNNCASGDSTADNFSGSNNRVDQTFTFVNHDGNDFHLDAADAGAINYGKDLSATFTDDVDGETRPTGANTWDIGFDEYIGGEEPIDLVPAEGAQAQAADAPALTQVHILVVAEGVQTQGSDAPALTQVHTLVSVEGVQVQASDAPALTQVHILAAQEGVQTEVADAPVLTQAHVVTPAEGVQVEISDSPVLTQAHILVAAEGAQVQISDAPALTQAHALGAQEGSQIQASDDTPAVTQVHVLATAEGVQEQISDQATITVGGVDLVAAEGIQVQISDTPAVTQTHILVPAEGVQAQISDAPVLAQVHVLSPAKGFQAQVSDAAILDLSILLATQKGYQAQYSDSPALTEISAHTGVPSSLWASKKGLHRPSRTKWYKPGIHGQRWYRPLERWFR